VIATEIEADSQHFDTENRVFDGNEVLQYCPGLMSIVDAGQSDRTTTKELHLAHFSVKEFLGAQESFKLSSASQVIARTCLIYLTEVTGSHNNIKREFPLAQFAAEYWTGFGASAESFDNLFLAIREFLKKQVTFERWCRLHQADRSWDDNPGPPRASRLYYACFGGLRRMAQELVDEGADVNAQGGQYCNALQAASYGGHIEIRELLLDKGADINAQGGLFNNALQAASYRGHIKIMKLLLDKGADINAQGGQFGNALQAASYEGHIEIVKLLLDKGADINALQAASYRGHIEIVKLLLDKGADINAQGGQFGNALQAASYEGHIKVIKLLLDKGADINAQGGQYSNALQAALHRGHIKIMKLLLIKGQILVYRAGTIAILCKRGQGRMSTLLHKKWQASTLKAVSGANFYR
jgi:hypothetical protein